MRPHYRTIRFLRGVAVPLLVFLCTAQQASAIGVCREVNCPCTEEQLKQGMVDTDQGCSKCDKAALEKARAEFKKWYGIYKDQSANADALWAEAARIYQEGIDEFEKFWRDQFYGKLPQPIRVYFNEGTNEEIAKEAVRTLKALLKKIRDKAFAKAVKAATWAEFVGKLLLVEAKMLTKLQEGEPVAAEAEKAADAAYESLQKAIAAKERMDELEKNCQAQGSSSGKPGPTKNEDDEWKSSAEREAEAAQEILKSWKKVEGGYEDSEGNFYQADLAMEAALDIVRSRQGAFSGWHRVFVSLGFGDKAMTAQAQAGDDELSDEQATRFGEVLARGFEHFAQALEDFNQIGVELQKIGQLRGKGKRSR